MPGIVSIDRRTEVVGGMSSVEARPWDSSPAVCRCQLIIWGPGQNGDLDVSPDTPQELIPAAYTNVVMEPDGVWEGRFMLLPPNTASQPPAQDWIIEALDRHGRVTSALEFARLNGHSVSWSSQIIGAPTMCEEYLRFQVRRAFNGAVSDPRDPNDD